MKLIQITVDKSGQVTIQTHGYEGDACRDPHSVAAKIKAALGGDVVSETKTAEAFVTPQTTGPQVRQG